MTVQERALSLGQQLQPLIMRELAGIAAIDTAIAHETAPDYVVMFHDSKNSKQANSEQPARRRPRRRHSLHLQMRRSAIRVTMIASRLPPNCKRAAIEIAGDR